MTFRNHKYFKNTNCKLVASCLLFAISTGCVQTPGARSSIWPTKTVKDPTMVGSTSTAESIAGKVSGAAKGVKGQFASMGVAVSSAYGKAKSTVTSAFTTTPASTDPNDPTSINNKPNNLGPEVFVIQGNMYESNGNYPKAIDLYSKALEIEPNNLAALSSLARLNNRQQNSEKAIEYFQKAIAVAPKQVGLYSELGDTYLKSGKLSLAKEQYQKAIELEPKERKHRASLASVLIDEGQAERAQQELAQVDPPAMASYQMAYLYMNRQNIPAARQCLTNALTIDPNLQPARDLMNSLGGPQLAQQAGQMYQQSGQIYQQVGQLGASVQNAFAPYSPPNATPSATPSNTLVSPAGY